MAIEPYRQRIGVPQAENNVSPQLDTRTTDVSEKITRVGQQILDSFEPKLRQRALDHAKEAASKPLERGEDGQLILPDAPDGGVVFRTAFDMIVQKRYVDQIGYGFQEKIRENEQNRRTGVLPFDYVEFAKDVETTRDGILAGVDPAVMGEVEELLNREATESLNAFGSEYSRVKRGQLIQGEIDVIAQVKDRIARSIDLDLSVEDREKLREKADEAADNLLTLSGLGDTQVAVMLSDLGHVDGQITRYLTDSKALHGMLVDLPNMSEGMLEVLAQAAANPHMADGNILADYGDGSTLERVVSPGTESGGGAQMRHPVEGATIYQNGGKFGDPRDGGKRRHKGVDLPVPNMTPVRLGWTVPGRISYRFQENGAGHYAVVEHKDGSVSKYMHLSPNGMPLTNGAWVDENTIIGYSGKSGNPSGYTLHYEWSKDGVNASDPTSMFGKTHDWKAVGGSEEEGAEPRATFNPEASDVYTYERFRALHPAIREQLGRTATDVAREKKSIAVEAARRADEERRHEQQIAEARETRESIEAALDDGYGGRYTRKQEKVLDADFKAGGYLKEIGTREGRANILRFLQDKIYIPDQMLAYMETGITGPNWRPTLDFYVSVGEARTVNGELVGEMLLERLGSRERAMLQHAADLNNGGSTEPEIKAFLTAALTRNMKTPEGAISEYNQLFSGVEGRGFTTDLRQKVKETYGLNQVPEALEDEIRRNYVTRLSLLGQTPTTALKDSIELTTKSLRASHVFAGGVGPRSLVDNYKPQQILNVLAGSVDESGNHILPRILKGPKTQYTMGKQSSSVKLIPLGNDRAQIGEYEVIVYDPNTGAIVNSVTVELGPELRRRYPSGGRGRASSTSRMPQAREKQRVQKEQGTRQFEQAMRPFSNTRNGK